MAPGVKALLFMKHHSERVPGKNLRLLQGRPLFHWILDTLSGCPRVGEIVINTDSEEIAASAAANFAVTIHMRPEHLLRITGNEANQIMAYDLALTSGEHFLQTHSTNPLLTGATVERAIGEYFQAAAENDSLLSVTPLHKRFYWADGRPVNHDPHRMVKTQELPVMYEENSCLYLFSRTSFNRRNDRIGERPRLFPIDRLEALDIDEEEDFRLADHLMAARRGATRG